MPLIQSKSDKARSENIKKEIAAGKPKDQAIAIAYETQRRAKEKNKSYPMPDSRFKKPSK
jgi:hypothetical protein